MKGILKSVELVEYTNKEKGNKFKKLNFTCDCENAKGDIITLKGSYSEEYARKYFAYCNLKTKDAIGKEVEVVTARKKIVFEDGERVYTYIKFMNFLDKDGKPIIMKKEESESKELDF